MTSLYLFDYNQDLIKIIPEKDLVEARQKEELQENDLPIDRFTAEYRLETFKDVEEIHFMAVKDLDDNNQFHMYYVNQPITNENTVVLEGTQLGYKELKHFVVKENAPRDRQASFMLEQALSGTGWRLGYVDETSQSTLHFYFLPVLEVLKEISVHFGIELVFKVEISGQKITDKWVEAYHRRGARTMKRFTHGSNLLNVKGTIERSEVYTALIGRGRGEEVGDGFGRAITFEDVEWKISNGDPVNKPRGQNYVEIPNATDEFGINMPDGSKSPALGVFEDTEIEEPEELLRATYNELVHRIRPLVQYETTVADIGKVELGEVVGIHRYDLGLHYETRISKLERNYLFPERTPVELGDKVYESRKERAARTQRTINNINREQSLVREEISHVVKTADGMNVITFSNVEPDRKRVGDQWVRDHPTQNGHTQWLMWNGDDWIITIDTYERDENARKIAEQQQDLKEAKEQADHAVEQIDVAVENAGFTTLDETISSVQSISNAAQASADVARDHALDALSGANTAMTDARSAVNTADSAISTANEVKGLANDLAGQVSDFEVTVDGFNQVVNNYEGQVSEFRNSVDGYASTVANYEVELDEYGNLVDSYATEVSSMRNTVDGFESTVASYGDEVAGYADDVSRYESQVSTFKNTVDGLNSTVANYEIELDEYGNVVSQYATQVSQFRNSVDGLTSEIATYQEDVQGYEAKVVTLENTVNGFNSTVQRVESDYNDLSGTVRTHTTQISNMDGRISAKANQDTVDTLAGTVNSLGTEFDAVAGKVNSRVWNTDIENAIDDISVGGRNLLRDSDLSNVNSTNWASRGSVTETVNGIEAIKIIGDSPSGNRAYLEGQGDNSYFLLEPNTEYIYSAYIYSEDSIEVTYNFPLHTHVRFGGNAAGGRKDMKLLSPKSTTPNEWNRIIISFKTVDEKGIEFKPFFYGRLSKDTTIWLSRFQLEQGNKITPWTPAPEDTLARFDHIETEWTQTFDSFKQTVSSIDGRVTAQSQTIDSIKSTVGNIEGDIATMELNINGLQTTVASKASQSQVTQLSNLVDTKVTSSQVNSLIQSDKTIKDTREDNETPEWYLDNYRQETVREFKRNSILGISGEGTYGVLETIIPWRNSSGGRIKQTLTTDHGVWERTGLGTTWEDWRKTADRDWVGAQLSITEDNINARVVQKDEVIAQINLSSEGILLDAAKVHVGSSTTIDDGIITNRMVAGDISADKVTVGTLNGANVRVINLDFNTAVGNATEFVQSYWNEAAGGGVRITGSGLHSIASDRSEALVQNGVFLSRQPNQATIGYIGYNSGTTSPFYTITTTLGANFSIRSLTSNGYRSPLEIYPGSDEMYLRTSEIWMMGTVRLRGGAIDAGNHDIFKVRRVRAVHFGDESGAITFLNDGNNRATVKGRSGVSFGIGNADWAGGGYSRVMYMDNSRVYFQRDISMNGNAIRGESDRRLKTNIHDYTDNILEDFFEIINPVTYNWKSPDKTQETQIGLIAQDTPFISGYDKLNDKWEINMGKQVMVNTIGVKQLAIQHENTLELASAAYIGIEEHQETLDNHDSRIESLEKELEEANQKIKELERKVA